MLLSLFFYNFFSNTIQYKGLDLHKKIDQSIKTDAEDSITKHQNNIASHKTAIDQKGDDMRQAVSTENHHKRSHSLIEDAFSNIDVSDKNRNE